MKGERYRGYRSYAYLEAGRDYRPYRMAPQEGRVPDGGPNLTPDQAARAVRLMEEGVAISLHDHPTVMPLAPSEFVAYRKDGRDVTGYAGLARSGLDAVFDGMADGEGIATSSRGWKWADTVLDLGMRMADLAHQDFLVRAGSVSDILAAKAAGRIAWIPALEGAMPIENELDRIDVLYGLGFRMMGVTYSDGNALGSGLREPKDGGLTAFGRAAVRRMRDLGMAIDTAHCGDRTALDVMEAARGPVFVSHAGARAVWPSPRMKPDDVLRAVAACGGVLGVEAAPHSTLSRHHPGHDLDAVMAHFEHCANVMGIDHVGFGPDTMYGDHVAFHGAFGHLLPEDDRLPKWPDHAASPYVSGMENPTEALRNGVAWLVAHGFSDDDILKAMGGNALRALATAWASGGHGP